MSRTINLSQLVLPLGSNEQTINLVDQLNIRLRVLEAEFNRLSQNVYVRGNTEPYFLPTTGAVAGYKLVYTTRLDINGNILPSAEWVP